MFGRDPAFPSPRSQETRRQGFTGKSVEGEGEVDPDSHGTTRMSQPLPSHLIYLIFSCCPKGLACSRKDPRAILRLRFGESPQKLPREPRIKALPISIPQMTRAAITAPAEVPAKR